MEYEWAMLAAAVKGFNSGSHTAGELVYAATRLLDENSGLTGEEWRAEGDPLRQDGG